jgi:hypothetical protein
LSPMVIASFSLSGGMLPPFLGKSKTIAAGSISDPPCCCRDETGEKPAMSLGLGASGRQLNPSPAHLVNRKPTQGEVVQYPFAGRTTGKRLSTLIARRRFFLAVRTVNDTAIQGRRHHKCKRSLFRTTRQYRLHKSSKVGRTWNSGSCSQVSYKDSPRCQRRGWSGWTSTGTSQMRLKCSPLCRRSRPSPRPAQPATAA